MWQFLLLMMFLVVAFLVFRKQEKKRNNPRAGASHQLVDKIDMADVIGEDILDTFKTR